MGAWTWEDPTTSTVFNLNVLYSDNTPGSDQMNWQRNFTYELQPIASAQPPFLFEGQAQPTQMTLQGLLLTQANVQNMQNMYLIERSTMLTDDRGVQRVIFPTSLQMTRMASALYPWKTSFQLVTFVFQIIYPSS